MTKQKKIRSDFDTTGSTQIKKKFYIYKRSAEMRGYEFKLSKRDFVDLIYGDCYYCGASPSTEYCNTPNRKNAHFIVINGIDRIDNSIGYIYSNVVSCCKHCNYMKGTMGKDDFISLCKSVTDNMRYNNE